MDEPFGAIDPVTRDRLQDELLRLQDVLRKTIVFVTHDIDEAIKLGDRVALLAVGGRLAQYTSPAELLARPASEFVASFLGEGRMVRRLGLLRLRDVPLDGAQPGGDAVRVSVDATLRDALDAVLRSANGRAAVVDGDRVVGAIDADLIRTASRAPANETLPSAHGGRTS